MRYLCPLLAVVLLCGISGAATAGPTEAPNGTADAPTTVTPRRLATAHLPNAVQLHPRVISGGLPEGDAAFAELEQLGVKTIISVDGAKPDVQAAARHGLRYVHLPHGYDGIPEERGRELAKAVRELDGPIYIHCHHGKHRSPAAATVACVSTGLLPANEAVAVLKLAGTSPNYRGLYESAERARRLEDALLDELYVEFQSVVEIPPLAEAMVALEHTNDHVKAIAAADWRTPADHPDLDPAHEALLLREHFTEMLRVDEVRSQPEEFQAMLRESEESARRLETALRRWQPAAGVAPPEAVTAPFARITANCKACHEKYRDVPLSEK
ncbi:MAG: cytochrome c [Planctomycetales bacterium]|nr:cytochrome c [Planctomycetales bacterium]